MFYVKDVDGRRYPLERDNIFSVCPGCGCEFNVTAEDYAWFVTEFDDDHRMYCGECDIGEPEETTEMPKFTLIQGKGRIVH